MSYTIRMLFNATGGGGWGTSTILHHKSFIVYSYFPAAIGALVPIIIVSPGWGSGSSNSRSRANSLNLWFRKSLCFLSTAIAECLMSFIGINGASASVRLYASSTIPSSSDDSLL